MIEVSLTSIMSIMFLCGSLLLVYMATTTWIRDEMRDVAIAGYIMAFVFVIPQFFIWGWIVITV